jgi:hypothetical protein
MRTDAEIMEEICELELEGLTQAELEGAHTALCGLLLIRTALSCRGGRGGRRFGKREAVMAKIAAQKWQEGGTGEWTFESVCSSLGMSTSFARRQIARYAEAVDQAPINTESAPKYVFGRPNPAKADPMEFNLLDDLSPDTPDQDYWEDFHAHGSPEAATAY